MARSTLAAVSLVFTAVFLLLQAGCATTIRRYPLAEPLWEDPDRNNVGTEPKEYYSGFAWDTIDQTLFWPVTRVLSVDVIVPSINVNAFDEVPNSSWFENRIGLGEDWTLEDSARGSCPDELLSTDGPWTVVAAKPNGANPGFIVKGDDGHGYMLKMDGGFTAGERATTADVFGSRLYQAAGFHAPCNTIVFFDPVILAIDPDATTVDLRGKKQPMTREDVDAVLDMALVLPDGRLRASASLFLPGKPIGPWTYQGTRVDDPNDVIRHEDRRDLRGARLIAAWLNHFDAREQNTLAMWAEQDGRQFVMHHYLDFGDCLGSRWEIDGLSRRFGYSHYLHIGHVLTDFITLGAIPRPWHQVQLSEVAPTLGYFDAEHFDPPQWKAGYPNPAFTRMQAGDGAWMARILAHVTDDHLRVMLAEGQMGDEQAETELLRILVARRDKILDHYLLVRSPLAHFETLDDPDWPRLCFTDLALTTGVTDGRAVRYQSRMYFGDFDTPRWTRDENTGELLDGTPYCVDLVQDGERPAARHPLSAPAAAARYAILDLLVITEPGEDPQTPARLHFYDLGDAGFRLVGIERPGNDRAPGKR